MAILGCYDSLKWLIFSMNLDMWYVFFDFTLYLQSELAFSFTVSILALEIVLKWTVFVWCNEF